jgi:hypothetical protein
LYSLEKIIIKSVLIEEIVMWTQRDIILFFAGFEAFHTLSHIMIGYLNILPIKFLSITWTQQLNLWGIVINAFITVGLLWWASRLK